jgi:hypothetical protein
MFMRRKLCALGVISTLVFVQSGALRAQESAPPNPLTSQSTSTAPTPAEPTSTEPAKTVRTVKLKQDTPVELITPSEIRSDRSAIGARFRLRVNKPIQVDNQIIVPVGATAWGEVTQAEGAGIAGKKGALSARLLYIELGSVQIPIEGNVSSQGRGLSPAVLLSGVYALFAAGNNGKIKAGEIITAFIAQDFDYTLPAPLQQASQ